MYIQDGHYMFAYLLLDYEIGHVTVYIKFKDEIALLTATKSNVKKIKNMKHVKQKI